MKTSKAQKTAALNSPDLSHFDDCIRDVCAAEKSKDQGPAEPIKYKALCKRLETAKESFPPLYRRDFVDPFLKKLNDLKDAQFDEILRRDPKRTSDARLLLDAAQAILQYGEQYQAKAMRAFQEVVSDLYDGFLSAEDRRYVKPPDKGTTPPLVKWGCPEIGAYTWTSNVTEWLDLRAGIVCLPPANTRQGLLAWAALAHETTGHDILAADTGLLEELTTAVRDKVTPLSEPLADYWSTRVDETASDVLGILNMGQAAAIGMVGYLRGSNLAYADKATLGNTGYHDDEHPADILRGFLAAETVRLLAFTGRNDWATAVLKETQKDVDTIRVKGRRIDSKLALRSAKLTAKAIVTHPCQSLEGHALGDIQNWRDTDEHKVLQLHDTLRTGKRWDASNRTRFYAAHAVAAAVLEALASGDIGPLFKRMLAMLNAMHDHNSSWGPLLVRHPGNLTRRFAHNRRLLESLPDE